MAVGGSDRLVPASTKSPSCREDGQSLSGSTVLFRARGPCPALPLWLLGLRVKAGLPGPLRTAPCMAGLDEVCAPVPILGLLQVGRQRPSPPSPFHPPCLFFLPSLLSWSWLPTPHTGHVMEKLVMGRGQEVAGWGPGQGQADKGRRLVQEVPGTRDRGLTEPRGQQEGLSPSPVSGPLPYRHHSFILFMLCPGTWRL